MRETDVQALRAHGFRDAAIHDAAQIVAYFNYINRIADALGVDHETFVRAWEQPLRPGAAVAARDRAGKDPQRP